MGKLARNSLIVLKAVSLTIWQILFAFHQLIICFKFAKYFFALHFDKVTFGFELSAEVVKLVLCNCKEEIVSLNYKEE